MEVIGLAEKAEGKENKYFQSIIMIIACLFFVILFLALAIMNSKRIEMTLIEVQVDKAISIIEGIEKVAQEHINFIERWMEGSNVLNHSTGINNESFRIHESLAVAIVNKAQELDAKERDGKLKSEMIDQIAKDSRITIIAFIDMKGNVNMKNRPVPSKILEETLYLIRSGKDVVIRLFNPSGKGSPPAYVALKRQGSSGIVLIVMEKEDMLEWGVRISIQEALSAMEWRKGVIYEEVRDFSGYPFANSGEIIERSATEYSSSISVKTDRGEALIRMLKGKRGNIIEVISPFIIGGKVFGEARVGLDPVEMKSILGKNRIYIVISTSLIASLGILAIVFLHISQSRHHKKLQEIRDRLHQSERLAALWRLAGIVAHEVRNPLNSISMAVQRIGREYAPKELQLKEDFYRITGIVKDEIRRIDRIIQDFLGISRSGQFNLQPVSIKNLIERLRLLLESEASSRSIRIITSEDGKIPDVLIDPDKTLQALLNIVKNSIEAIEGQGSISINIMMAEEGKVSIEISDTGHGIAPEEVEKIFDPGYTTKEKGLGLGLSIAHEIVKMQGGEISVESQKGKGTTFLISFPSIFTKGREGNKS